MLICLFFDVDLLAQQALLQLAMSWFGYGNHERLVLLFETYLVLSAISA